jgi:transposase
MKPERRNYDKEFKIMAVELVESGKTTMEVANDLGIRRELVCRWRREYLDKTTGSFSGHGNSNFTDEQKEIAQLKKELRDTQMERDILKKAVSIFSKNDGKF